MTATGSMEARYYDKEFSLIKFTSKRKDGGPKESIHGLKTLCGNPKGDS